MLSGLVGSTGVLKPQRILQLVDDWKQDAVGFLRDAVPRLFLIALVSFVLIWILRLVTSKAGRLQSKRLPGVRRAAQVLTLAEILHSVGVTVILFVATLMALSVFRLNLGPLLASAGIVGLAIGFGAQTLVKDVLNGFFILLEDQYDVGDFIRIAGVQGRVETMSLRRTVLRDDDGTVHTIPNSEIKIVSNATRDWSQVSLRVSVADSEPSDRVIRLLQEVGSQLRGDPTLGGDIFADIEVPGIDRIAGGEAEYLVQMKTRPGRQNEVRRELRRRIKDSLQQNQITASESSPAQVKNDSAA